MNKVFVLDFGSQYTQLIARRVRELGVYAEIHPYNVSLSFLKKESPQALVLSGGPQSVYEKGAPSVSPEIFNLGFPVLGICYGLQLLAHLLGGEVVPGKKREYGLAELKVIDQSGLLHDLNKISPVWMSHGDQVKKVPPGFAISGVTVNTKAAVIENKNRKIFGVQFHPEVAHTAEGKKILRNFLFRLAKLKPDWSMGNFVETKVKEIKEKVGQAKVIAGLSGGVDSLVASLLVHRAIGQRLLCVFVDNGLLRKGQYEADLETFRKRYGLKVIAVKAADRFINKLKGVISPERKRKIIGRTFIEIFEEQAKKFQDVQFLAQGTIYPDVIESAPVKGPSATIKSHHNVGGLPARLPFKLIEPLRELFKDEVRQVGFELGVDREFLEQHPFPGPGLAVRIVGEVTPERLAILREADEILLQEVKKAALYDKLWQAFAVLLPVRSVGVMGDQRTYQQVVVLRLVQSLDGMTANWYPASAEFLSKVASRIVNEVAGVNRVVYDITTKPPATIEWE
ncbi:MAG: glutamine-hydrolyzing GMP synthase [Candidatus Aminicenantes bacterium]|nr:glutamine-hydrolyzing GMP synthase [Candidatus Aminicenantes bacterium]